MAIEKYIKALGKGLLKTMSKMGISTLRSYRSAQVFQAVGLNRDVVAKYFTGTASHVEGIGLDEIAVEANERYHLANHPPPTAFTILPSGGSYKYRTGRRTASLDIGFGPFFAAGGEDQRFRAV